ncbi:MAG TPA: ATP synthase F0 subunit B [Thermoanaerobaculia bacterium]|nr:ATP synthase F0 subunit B [Thermoanaerobaculia bacterium]
MSRLFATLFVLFLALVAPPLLAEETGATVARGAASETHEDVHGGGHEGEAHAEKEYFGVPAWILKLVNMILFAGLLTYLLKGPIGRAFADRRERIKRELAEAEQRRLKADQLASDIQSRLDEIEKEVALILLRAAEEGERQKNEMIAQGKADAEKVLAQARNAVDAQLKHAKQELTEFAGQLATERALHLLETQMTDADRKKIFAEGLEEIRS